MEVTQTVEADSLSELTPGVFLIDKPAGVSSFFIVKQIRRLLGIKKVGHAGTLDPFATGLLIVCVGRPATRMIDRIMVGSKEYSAVLQLGIETETQDPEGTVIAEKIVPVLTDRKIIEVLNSFKGKQLQAPPPFSAAKFKGKPLYYYARKGIKITKDPKEIDIMSISFIDYDSRLNQLEISVKCSKGTYIRVLGADIGKKLGCGAHLIALRRLSSGLFSVKNSLQGEKLRCEHGYQNLLSSMITLEEVEKLI